MLGTFNDLLQTGTDTHMIVKILACKLTILHIWFSSSWFKYQKLWSSSKFAGPLGPSQVNVQSVQKWLIEGTSEDNIIFGHLSSENIAVSVRPSSLKTNQRLKPTTSL